MYCYIIHILWWTSFNPVNMSQHCLPGLTTRCHCERRTLFQDGCQDGGSRWQPLTWLPSTYFLVCGYVSTDGQVSRLLSCLARWPLLRHRPPIFSRGKSTGCPSIDMHITILMDIYWTFIWFIGLSPHGSLCLWPMFMTFAILWFLAHV